MGFTKSNVLLIDKKAQGAKVVDQLLIGALF
jgi:hypothetical protein